MLWPKVAVGGGMVQGPRLLCGAGILPGMAVAHETLAQMSLWFCRVTESKPKGINNVPFCIRYRLFVHNPGILPSSDR